MYTLFLFLFWLYLVRRDTETVSALRFSLLLIEKTVLWYFFLIFQVVFSFFFRQRKGRNTVVMMLLLFSKRRLSQSPFSTVFNSRLNMIVVLTGLLYSIVTNGTLRAHIIYRVWEKESARKGEHVINTGLKQLYQYIFECVSSRRVSFRLALPHSLFIAVHFNHLFVFFCVLFI